MKLMSLEFPLNHSILTAVRLVTGGICAQLGFDLDGTEDCKVCVTESLLMFSRRGGKNVRVVFEKEDCLKISFESEKTEQLGEKTAEDEISVALLSALVHDLFIDAENGRLRISFGIGSF